jgi:hypothetical protein
MAETIGSLLNDALAWYWAKDPDDIYDEVLRTVSERAAEAKSLGKADIGSLVLWKRITAQAKWATKLGMTPDCDVRAATGEAWRILDDAGGPSPAAAQEAREALRRVPGLGPAMASAVLLACAPDRMAIWDRRVGIALTVLDGSIPPSKNFFSGYLTRVLELAAQMESEGEGGPVTARHVDIALWDIAGSVDLLARAKTLSVAG